jgi:hypothetical protein
MCVVIVDGKTDDLFIRTGVDVESASYKTGQNDTADNYDDILNNMGPGHQYPGGPTCCYNGKTIPCMVAFNPGGGITAKILTDILRTLDKLEIFPHKNQLRPFLLVDGHSTRFDIEFLEYINAPAHRWSVCIGVPYGTSLWQMGDSVYQNGQFKVKATKKKEMILEFRHEKQMGIEIIPTDIIPIVNYAWSGSFDNVETNVKAILERGWFPLNRMLLLHPDIRKTMTQQDFEQEQEAGFCPKGTQSTTSSLNPKSNSPNLPTMDTTSFNKNNKPEKHYLQFKGDTASHCLKKIVQEHDFQLAREKIIEDKKQGKELHERILSLPRPTAARLIIDGRTHTLGEDLKDLVKKNAELKREAAEKKRLQGIETYKKDKSEYDIATEKNKDKPCLMAWTVSDLKAVVKMEKNKEDGPMPTTKRGIADLYAKCMDRKGEKVLVDAPTGSSLTVGLEAEVKTQNDSLKTAI